jgi:hypothetical protein
MIERQYNFARVDRDTRRGAIFFVCGEYCDADA